MLHVTIDQAKTTLAEIPDFFGERLSAEKHSQGLRVRLAAIEAEIKETLPIERDHKENLEKVARRLSREIELYQKDTRMANLDRDYQRLDLTFLGVEGDQRRKLERTHLFQPASVRTVLARASDSNDETLEDSVDY